MANRAEPEESHGNAGSATATAEPARVFISYASQDKRAAEAICEALENAALACWMAPRNVTPSEL